jgi:hypothetical protein
MSVAFATERRLLAEDELEPIQRSHFPLLEGLAKEELVDLARWLRDRRARARDLMRDGRRARRGKAAPRGGGPGGAANSDWAERGLAAKKQVYAGALKRVNARLEAIVADERRALYAARLRDALARKQAEAALHPGAGRTAGAGTHPRPSRKPRPTIHGARIGSVSQAGRNAQARRDARG